jgi:hypothetical protein
MTLILPIHNTPNYDDTSQPLREGNTVSSALKPLRPSFTKQDADPFFGPYIEVNDEGDTVGGNSGYIPIFRPQYQKSIKTHRYIRALSYGGWNTLSTSDQAVYNDLSFGEYIHYVSNPRGGQGLVDTSPYEVKTSITMSRDARPVIYSPYG